MKHSPATLANVYEDPEKQITTCKASRYVNIRINDLSTDHMVNEKPKISEDMKIKCGRELTCLVSSDVSAGGKGLTELGCNLCSSGMETTASFSDLLSKDKRKLLLLSLILLLRIVTRSPMSPASETLSHSASSLSV